MPDDSEVMREIFKLRPPTTRAQAEARNRAGQLIEDQYPGEYIAYVDTWNGDELDRTVVAHSPDPSEFQRLLAALEPAVRDRVELTRAPDPDEGFFIGG